jgi:class 3 adenylate cyclase/tetratricopeptide (TPR) repeat protein
MSSVETVTILITDLVGSTGLESRIGPGAADDLRGEHFSVLRAAIEESGGREVKNTGDGLIGAFESASAAVGCAVLIQQRLERRNRTADEQLLIKVGISLGDATAAEGDYFGMPVIEAARLCDRASGGQILAKEIVAHLAGGRAGHAFKPLGDLGLKGLPEPLSTVEVTWEPLGEQGSLLPLPPRLQGLPPVAFVGRSAERERLRALFEDACEGKRRVALISGEPGIGKSRLSSLGALDARASGATVLYGGCNEELVLPYGLWVEALSHYVKTAPEQVLRAHVERHGGELTRLVPALEDRLPDVPAPRGTDPDTERYLLWGAIAGLLRAASSDEPVVVVLDDLHWADKPTLLLLKHVVAHGAEVRALLIATYRESDLARSHPLTDVLADLHREQGVERIALKGLDEPEIVEIMERAAGHELDEVGMGLAHELFRETDGNPFYTGELMRHLLESGGIYREDDGPWAVRGSLSELGLPQSVREVVGRRVERLGEEAQKVLRVAAVIGREFDQELLRRVTEHSEDAILDLLEEAVEASVLSESANVAGRFSFAHALIAHTLYEDIGTTRRARAHRRVAEELEELLGPDPGARVSELAYHLARATAPLDVPKAMVYARLAGERALSELAPDEALRWFAQALELQRQQAEVDPVECADLLIGLGEGQRQVGEAAFRETLLEASGLAFELGDADRAARAALANSRGQVSVYGEVDRERLLALGRALELDDFAHPARCARLMSLQAMELVFDPDHEHRRALAEEALALARDTGDPRTLAHVLRGCFPAIWTSDTLALRQELVGELLEAAAQAGDPALEAWAALEEVNVGVESAELERAVAAAARLQGIADEIGEPTLRWFAAFYGACLALLHGDLAEAERLAEEALQIGSDAGQPDALMIYGAQLAQIRPHQGRTGKMVQLVEESMKAHPGIPAWRAGLAQIYCWVGRTAEAAAILEEAAADGFVHLPHDEERATALALYAEVASEVGARDAAAALYELIEPWADQILWNGGVTYGHVRTYLGLLAATLGLDERADEHFALACDIQEKKGMLLWAARARLGWAEALAERGERERAGAEAARALALAREHGYVAIERRAAALVETGSPTPR